MSRVLDVLLVLLMVVSILIGSVLVAWGAVAIYRRLKESLRYRRLMREWNRRPLKRRRGWD